MRCGTMKYPSVVKARAAPGTANFDHACEKPAAISCVSWFPNSYWPNSCIPSGGPPVVEIGARALLEARQIQLGNVGRRFRGDLLRDRDRRLNRFRRLVLVLRRLLRGHQERTAHQEKAGAHASRLRPGKCVARA